MPEDMPGETGPPEGTSPGMQSITPELVDEIADKVYAMLLLDLAIESERRRPPSTEALGIQGGW